MIKTPGMPHALSSVLHLDAWSGPLSMYFAARDRFGTATDCLYCV